MPLARRFGFPSTLPRPRLERTETDRIGAEVTTQRAATVDLPTLAKAAGVTSAAQLEYFRISELSIVEQRLSDLVLISDSATLQIAKLYASRYPTARVHALLTNSPSNLEKVSKNGRSHLTVTTCSSVDDVHKYLDSIAAPQVIIEAGRHRPRFKTTAFLELLGHVDDCGTYIIQDLDALYDPTTTPWPGPDVWTALADLLALKSRPKLGADRTVATADKSRVNMIGEVRHFGNIVAVTKRGSQSRKLTHDEADRVLTRHSDRAWGRTLLTKPAHTVESRATVRTNLVDEEVPFVSQMQVPTLHLREFNNVICAPRQLVVADQFVMPISFHQPLRKHLINRSPYLRDAGRWFAQQRRLGNPDHLPGEFYHLDSEFPGHFGHFVTQDVGKLWGWHHAKSLYPQLKILLSTDSDANVARPKPFQLDMLGAYGIEPNDVICFNRPVRVDKLVGAPSMFYNAHFAHAEITKIWDTLRAALRPEPPTTPLNTKLYVSRRGVTQRPCTNEAALEQIFADHGFAVIRPEELSITEQVSLFATAEVVAGCGGSAMFNVIYCERPGRRIVVTSRRYRAQNEYTIAALRGDDYYHFYCEPDNETFHSPFAFDFTRDGAALEALLTS